MSTTRTYQTRTYDLEIETKEYLKACKAKSIVNQTSTKTLNDYVINRKIRNLNASFLANSPIVLNGLVLWLDAGASDSYPAGGTVWRDLAGSNNGTLTNGPTFSSANGGSVVFDGSDDYATLGTPSLLNGVQVPLTICMWAKANSFGTYNVLWSADKALTGGGLYSMLRLDSGILRYFTTNSSGGFQFNGSPNLTPSTNVWNFYAVTVLGTLSSPTVTLYLNNSSQTYSYSTLSSSPNLTVNFRIGSSERTNGEFWNGNISNAMWYNRALTSAEILQNYNATKGRFGL